MQRSDAAEPPIEPEPRRGDQTPRHLWVPPGAVRTEGQAVIDLASSIGMHLDPWERQYLLDSCGVREDDRWVATVCGLEAPRQNGKGVVKEARQLGGLFVFDEKLQADSAHEMKTTLDGLARLRFWIDNTDWLRRRVKAIHTANGKEAIELLNGNRIRFIARSKGSGRGFTKASTIYLDEAMILKLDAVAALVPAQAAIAAEIPGPQIHYLGSAPLDDPDSEPWRGVRRRGRAGGQRRLLFYGFTAADRIEDLPTCVNDDGEVVPDLLNPDAVAAANPGLGYRLTLEFCETELSELGPDRYARERLGIAGDRDESAYIIAPTHWEGLADPADKFTGYAGSQISGRPALAIDVHPQRLTASIGAAGLREDLDLHVEVVDHRAGTEWLVDRLVEVCDRQNPLNICLDPAGPAGSLIPDLQAAGFVMLGAGEEPPAGCARWVRLLGAREIGQACGFFYDRAVATEGQRIRHIDQPSLTTALAGAAWRNVGDARAYDRRNSDGDISPLYSCTFAVHALVTAPDDQTYTIDGSLMA